jgi:siroheme synthase-like protein
MFADLTGRKCVVVGGGLIAQRKVNALLRCAAAVTVVSPMLTARLAAAARRGAIRHLSRRFQPSDLHQAWLVYAATDDEAVNQQVFKAAAKARVFANIVDRTALCSFIAPAIYQQGRLTIAVSTGGASPTLAKQIRTQLGQSIGSEYGPMLRLLRTLRQPAQQALPRYADRKRYFAQVVDGQIGRLARTRRLHQAKQEALGLLRRQAAR